MPLKAMGRWEGIDRDSATSNVVTATTGVVVVVVVVHGVVFF